MPAFQPTPSPVRRGAVSSRSSQSARSLRCASRWAPPASLTLTSWLPIRTAAAAAAAASHAHCPSPSAIPPRVAVRPRAANAVAAMGLLTPPRLAGIGALMAFALSGALGANDVANSLGTSVGTGAVTLRQALVIGAVMEFSGAVLFGSTVTKTISSGVVTITAATLSAPAAFMLGMVTVLAGCTVWMAVATRFGLPVSSTHSVVGSLVGLGLISGWGINYRAVGNIITSWVLSPVIGGFIALLFLFILRSTIEEVPEPARATKTYLPFLSAITMFVLCLFVLSKGQLSTILPGRQGLILASIVAAVSALLSKTMTRNWMHDDVSREEQVEEVESVFKRLQIVTACLLSFSHGSNDVSNAIGPFAAIWAMRTGSFLTGAVATPIWVLVLGGLGISMGLAMFGKPVMDTVGKKITLLVPTKGFCVELATAATVLVASQLGLPVSTTHTLVGCIVAIGLGTGDREAVNGRVLGNIALSWGVTLPVSAFLTVTVYMLLLPLVPI